jgi:hypothetical protein
LNEYLYFNRLPEGLDLALAQYYFRKDPPAFTPEYPSPPALPIGAGKWLIHQTTERGPGIGSESYYMDYNRWNGTREAVRAYFGYKDEYQVYIPIVQAGAETARVKDSVSPWLNVRSQPWRDPVVGKLMPGEKFEILGTGVVNHINVSNFSSVDCLAYFAAIKCMDASYVSFTNCRVINNRAAYPAIEAVVTTGTVDHVDAFNFQKFPEARTMVGLTHKATAAEITTGTDDAKFVTAKAMKDADVNTRLKSKIITSTRDGTAASGDVAYTGIGFMPTSIHALMSIDGTLYWSNGVSDSAKVASSKYQSAANVVYSAANLVSYSNYSGWAQNATVKSYDADGFTLTWTKTATPSAATLSITFICFR